MRVNRNATPVIAHHQHVAVFQRNLDGAGVTGHRLVHRIVDDLGGQMVQRAFVGAADIHARPPAHRLQALQNLNVLGGIVGAITPGFG